MDWSHKYSTGKLLNWSCEVIPDIDTDVMIESGEVTVNINASVRTLTVLPKGYLTINPTLKF